MKNLFKIDVKRLVAYEALLAVEEDGAYSNLIINKKINEYNCDGSAFVRELVYGVLERKLTLDYYLDKLIAKEVQSKKEQLYTLLRMGLYQIIYMNSVPDYSACNETVSLSEVVLKGNYKGFINGVLRSFLRERGNINLPDGDSTRALSIRYSFPRWIVKLWIDQYGLENCIELLKSSNERPILSCRTNLIKTSPEELIKKLEESGFSTEKSKITKSGIRVKGNKLINSNLYKNGLLSVQDEASILAIETLKPRAGEMVLDMCAAPGGKSLACAEYMNNTGNIVSLDYYEHKIKLINDGAKRLGVNIIDARACDSTVEEAEFFERFDKVIIDGPCSGLGVIRRRPEIKYRIVMNKGLEFSKIQSKLLENASKYVKSGGKLLYSTCTINRLENDQVIENFLNNNDEFSVIFEKQLLPNIDDTDGFYICVLEKRSI